MVTESSHGRDGLRSVSLNDKYDRAQNPVLLNGIQALVRLLLEQRARDASLGLNTGGYISGYRGSPLGGIDFVFQAVAERFDAAGIVFNPGLNEDLAATAIWGTQQAELRGDGRGDGVFAMWYGKGPGVDRSGDVLRHGNLAGSSRHGGVLVLTGDDHGCESSTTAHQSEYALMDAMIPIFNPANIADLIAYGLHGWALSRYSGCWIGLKCVKDVVESTAIIDTTVPPITMLPERDDRPEDGLNIRRDDTPLQQEARLHQHKLAAVRAYCRSNRLDRVIFDGGAAPKLGLVTTGKAYNDVREALERLGIDAAAAASCGLGLYKVAMPWPLEPEGIRRFAEPLRCLLVIEEKRPLIETQMRDILFDRGGALSLIGKYDAAGAPLLPSHGVIDGEHVAAVLAPLLATYCGGQAVMAGSPRGDSAPQVPASILRTPYFCSGCPHSHSTRIPEDSRAYAGIGCHYMAQWMNRGTDGYTHMGAEGANWIGEHRFSKRTHVFQNIGDGTYVHSGILSIRAAVAAAVPMTFKILYNDAVAMTGGQTPEGHPSPLDIARQCAAEGVGRIALLTSPQRRPRRRDLPPHTRSYNYDKLMAVQRDLATYPGVSVLIYDRLCAAERRRRRKRGRYPQPERHVVINPLVCEGCGDCGKQSNCVSIIPRETEFGRKRAIDYTSCNSDEACLEGFCPSFVTLTGASPRALIGVAPETDLPEPQRVGDDFGELWRVLIVGAGGTGITTLAALLAMAAHLDGKAAASIDMAGLAQKGGTVSSHLVLASDAAAISSIRVGTGRANLLLGCDAAAVLAPSVQSALNPESVVIADTHRSVTGHFIHDGAIDFADAARFRAMNGRADDDKTRFADFTALAHACFDPSLAANMIPMMVLGYAWQWGELPLSGAAIDRAIVLNGVAIDENRRAFAWGRALALGKDTPLTRLKAADHDVDPATAPLDVVIDRRADYLIAYQDAAYAARYRDGVDRVRRCEQRINSAMPLTRAVALAYFRLLAIKDEYEVARLLTDPTFDADIAARFDGSAIKRSYHLSPPLIAPVDAATGRPRKYRFGAWLGPLLGVLARAKIMRGSRFDPFGYTHERRRERALIADYEAMIETIATTLTQANHDAAIALARSPDQICGYGPVKAAHLDSWQRDQQFLWRDFHQSAATMPAPVSAA